MYVIYRGLKVWATTRVLFIVVCIVHIGFVHLLCRNLDVDCTVQRVFVSIIKNVR